MIQKLKKLTPKKKKNSDKECECKEPCYCMTPADFTPENYPEGLYDYDAEGGWIVRPTLKSCDCKEECRCKSNITPKMVKKEFILTPEFKKELSNMKNELTDKEKKSQYIPVDVWTEKDLSESKSKIEFNSLKTLHEITTKLEKEAAEYKCDCNCENIKEHKDLENKKTEESIKLKKQKMEFKLVSVEEGREYLNELNDLKEADPILYQDSLGVEDSVPMANYKKKEKQKIEKDYRIFESDIQDLSKKIYDFKDNPKAVESFIRGFLVQKGCEIYSDMIIKYEPDKLLDLNTYQIDDKISVKKFLNSKEYVKDFDLESLKGPEDTGEWKEEKTEYSETGQFLGDLKDDAEFINTLKEKMKSLGHRDSMDDMGLLKTAPLPLFEESPDISEVFDYFNKNTKKTIDHANIPKPKEKMFSKETLDAANKIENDCQEKAKNAANNISVEDIQKALNMEPVEVPDIFQQNIRKRYYKTTKETLTDKITSTVSEEISEAKLKDPTFMNSLVKGIVSGILDSIALSLGISKDKPLLN